MKLPSLVAAVTSLILTGSAVLAQQDYIGHYDVYAGYMYLSSSLIDLGESGFHTQLGTNPAKWYSLGFDFSTGTGNTVLVPKMLKSSLQQQINAMVAPLEAAGIQLPPLQVPFHSQSQTFATGPQINYRHFKAVTLFIRPDLGAIHEDAHLYPNPDAALVVGLVNQLVPGDVKTDWTYFYGFGGGIDLNLTRYVGLRMQADFVRDHLFSDLLNARNSVRFSVGPTFHMGRSVAVSK